MITQLCVLQDVKVVYLERAAYKNVIVLVRISPEGGDFIPEKTRFIFSLQHLHVDTGICI
jgi:hypothetical protein